MQITPNSILKAASATKAEDTYYDDIPLPEPPTKPSKEESDRDYRVDRIDDELTFVTRDDDVCYHGSNALLLLSEHIHRRDLLSISRQQASRLHARLQLAEDALLPFFADADQRHVIAGLKSARRLVDWWALSKGKRKAQPSYLGSEHHLRVRWLQNACHNFAILDDLDENACSRRGNVITSLKSSTGATR